VLLLWLYSYRTTNALRWIGRENDLCLCLSRGTLIYWHAKLNAGHYTDGGLSYRPATRAFAPSTDFTSSATLWSRAGFFFGSGDIPGHYLIQIIVPYWSLAALGALPSLALIVKHAQRRRLLAKNLCPACGYDLRASAERCPECGRPIVKPQTR